MSVLCKRLFCHHTSVNTNREDQFRPSVFTAVKNKVNSHWQYVELDSSIWELFTLQKRLTQSLSSNHHTHAHTHKTEAAAPSWVSCWQQIQGLIYKNKTKRFPPIFSIMNQKNLFTVNWSLPGQNTCGQGASITSSAAIATGSSPGTSCPEVT